MAVRRQFNGAESCARGGRPDWLADLTRQWGIPASAMDPRTLTWSWRWVLEDGSVRQVAGERIRAARGSSLGGWRITLAGDTDHGVSVAEFTVTGRSDVPHDVIRQAVTLAGWWES
jgi:hypothetical protein